MRRIGADWRVAWVARAYRADGADAGPQSTFTIDPTVLLLSDAAAAAVGDIAAIEASASVDRARSSLLRGFQVISLPNGNAIDVAGEVAKAPGAGSVPGGVLFQNIPYISPVCGSCCSGGGDAGPACAPSAAAIIPNDTLFASQWGLQRINAPRAWPL